VRAVLREKHETKDRSQLSDIFPCESTSIPGFCRRVVCNKPSEELPPKCVFLRNELLALGPFVPPIALSIKSGAV